MIDGKTIRKWEPSQRKSRMLFIFFRNSLVCRQGVVAYSGYTKERSVLVALTLKVYNVTFTNLINAINLRKFCRKVILLFVFDLNFTFTEEIKVPNFLQSSIKLTRGD